MLSTLIILSFFQVKDKNEGDRITLGFLTRKYKGNLYFVKNKSKSTLDILYL